MSSIINYAGGKSKFIPLLYPILKKNCKDKKIISPFFGGGSFELYLASSGFEVRGYDIFEPVVNFWNNFFKHGNEVIDEIEKQFPFENGKLFERAKYFRENYNEQSKIIQAAWFLILSKIAFSALVFGRGATQKSRLSARQLPYLRKIANNIKNIDVELLPFEKSIDNDTFAYLDPPYLLKESDLYGNKGDTHKDFNHIALFDIIKNRKRWILSYNNCEAIKELYSQFRIFDLKIKTGVHRFSKKAMCDNKEILILSDDIDADFICNNDFISRSGGLF